LASTSPKAWETLTSVSATDAANGVTLCYLGGELISFRDATLTSTSHYTLGGQLYRGLYGSTIGACLRVSDFARLDEAIFKYTLPPQYIGQTLYFKFQSYNIFGAATQDLSTCTAYTFTPAGAGYGTGAAGRSVRSDRRCSHAGGRVQQGNVDGQQRQ
jgi:hypothetical protein